MARMTLGELIARLEDLAAEIGDDIEIRMAQQPNWPLEYSIGEVAEASGVVYIGEGSQIGYLDGKASRALGWSDDCDDDCDDDDNEVAA
jgi:heme oxygenase